MQELALAAGIALIGGAAALQTSTQLDLHWVRIPAGQFQMGCVPDDAQCLDNEQPRHWVTISQPFDLMETEVTVAHYDAFVRATGYPPPALPDFPQGPNHPAVLLDWDDATAFCAWAGGRLPTEAEWEYAARAGHDGWIYWWGNELSRDRANFGAEECCEGATGGADRWANTAPVGSLPPNDFGLYDITGNVWEWVADWHGDYPAEPVVDPRSGEFGFGRVARGASWLNFPAVTRVSVRLLFPPSGQTSNVGARCARDVAVTAVADYSAADNPGDADPLSPSRRST